MIEKQMMPFSMERGRDCTGVSGMGLVMVGAVNLFTGHCFTEWVVDNKPNSIGIYNSFAEFLAIHVFSHPDNQTAITMGEFSPLQPMAETGEFI